MTFPTFWTIYIIQKIINIAEHTMKTAHFRTIPCIKYLSLLNVFDPYFTHFWWQSREPIENDKMCR